MLETLLTHCDHQKYIMRPNSNKLIQACDWLTALLPSVVKNAKSKLHRIKDVDKRQYTG
jgi:hypothetical protein